MIPRILVPEGARLPEGEIVSTRRRPTNLDERTLVPSTLPIGPIDAHTNIPASMPLEAIATRTVVPRDIDIEKVQKEEESHLPAQPSELDERITIPQGVAPPEILPELPPIDAELVAPDIMRTGEAAFLTDESRGKLTLIEKINAGVSVSLHIAVVLLIIFAPRIFAPHVRSNEEEEMARRQITVLLPPGALESLKEAPKPPAPKVNVDPRIIRKVAPTVPKPVPVPEPVPEPKKELPAAPTPQPNSTPAPPTPQPKSDQPKAPLKLETPDTPQPKPNALILPSDRSPGDMIRDASRNNGRVNAPVPMGGGQIPSGGGQGGGGSRGGGLLPGPEILTDTQGVDFNDYLRRVYVTVKRNWFAVMPPSVQLGDQGVVSLQFKIYRDGTVVQTDPQVVYSSGKDPLDRAAVSSIRASNPFPQLPPQFSGPFIELRFTYYYNLRPPNM